MMMALMKSPELTAMVASPENYIDICGYAALAGEINENLMDVYTLDFETYYDKDYSLSKLTTEEYVRDKRFEVIGLAIKKNDKATKYINDPRLVERLLSHIDFSLSVLYFVIILCSMERYFRGGMG